MKLSHDKLSKPSVLGTNSLFSESYLLLATKHKIWKVSPLGDSAHEQTSVAVQGKVVALDFDSKNVSYLVNFTGLISNRLLILNNKQSNFTECNTNHVKIF